MVKAIINEEKDFDAEEFVISVSFCERYFLRDRYWKRLK